MQVIHIIVTNALTRELVIGLATLILIMDAPIIAKVRDISREKKIAYPIIEYIS